MSQAGDITEITFNHPVEGAFSLFCKSNESGTLEPGGFRNNDDDNSRTGDGRLLIQKNNRNATFEAPPIDWDMTDTDAQEKLLKVSESPILSDITINSITGKIWGGRGIPVGDIPGDTNTGLVTLKIAFENKLKSLS